jgi:methylphosphotriester-DNA--protein-cysteine methyltransferase
MNIHRFHPSDRIDNMEAFLLQHLTTNRPDSLIGEAIRLIKQQNGIVRIKDLSAALHISQDPFEKRFRAQVGSTPK